MKVTVRQELKFGFGLGSASGMGRRLILRLGLVWNEVRVKFRVGIGWGVD